MGDIIAIVEKEAADYVKRHPEEEFKRVMLTPAEFKKFQMEDRVGRSPKVRIKDRVVTVPVGRLCL